MRGVSEEFHLDNACVINNRANSPVFVCRRTVKNVIAISIDNRLPMLLTLSINQIIRQRKISNVNIAINYFQIQPKRVC